MAMFGIALMFIVGIVLFVIGRSVVRTMGNPEGNRLGSMLRFIGLSFLVLAALFTFLLLA